MNNISNTKYSYEECQKLATECVDSENDKLVLSIFRGKLIHSRTPNPTKERASKIERLARLLYVELPEKNISYSFFRNNATSYDLGLTVHYYGDSIVQLIRKVAKQEGLPEIVGGIQYSFIYRDLETIIKSQKKWLKESTELPSDLFYYISTSMIYNIDSLCEIDLSDEELQEKATAMVMKKQKGADDSMLETMKKDQYYDLKETKKAINDLIVKMQKKIPVVLIIKKTESWNECSALVAGVGKYKIFYNGTFIEQESMLNIDTSRTKLKMEGKDGKITYTPYYHFPVAMAQTKIEKECYISLYGKSLVSLSDQDADEVKKEIKADAEANNRENQINEQAISNHQNNIVERIKISNDV